MPLTPDQRRAQARRAAHIRYSKSAPDTRAALAGFARKFLDEVDPDRTLSETERLRRADHLRKAHYIKFSAAGVAARKAKAASGG